MRIPIALGAWIIVMMILASACSPPRSQNPATTNTPPASTAFHSTTDIANLATGTAVVSNGTPGPGAATLSLEQQLAEIGRRQRETLSASTAFAAPAEMRLHQEEKAQLLLSFRLPEGVLAGQVTVAGPVSSSPVEITPLMRAELVSPDPAAFQIVPLTETEQRVGDSETTEWLWYVTPTKMGSHTLSLVLSRGVKFEERVEWIKVTTFERSITVKGSFLDLAGTVGWPWIAGLLLIALASLPLLRRLPPSPARTVRARTALREAEAGPGAGFSSTKPLGHIFISYRRSDSADIAGRIYDRLVDEYGHAPIFKDVDSIPLGSDFKEYLDRKVSESNVLLAVIGDRWVDASDPAGRQRLEDPTDFVRVEIESALERGIPVIPLLVRAAQMPGEDRLPPGLKKLAYKNGLEIRPDPDFHRDMDRLVMALDGFLRAGAQDQS